MRRRCCTCAPATSWLPQVLYETQFLFANNDLPGVMLSTAVLRLLHQHGIAPGKRAVLIGEADRCSQLQAELEAAGIEVVASVPIDSVVSAKGEGHVSGVVTRDCYL